MKVLKRAVGPGAGARKYDILSALMAHGLAGDQHRQRLVMRFMALITTRYNWKRNELSMGQAEIARLWSVDPRTVKREMARLKALGWLVVKRAGARGRVGLYAIDLDRLTLDTRPEWDRIGADFTERMGHARPPQVESNIVALRPRRVPEGHGVWAQALRQLEAEDPAIFQTWFAPLTEEGIEGGVLSLIAPSRFHVSYVKTHLWARLWQAVRRADPSIARIEIGT